MSWLADVFGVKKPVIGMCHLSALPGDPAWDAAGGMKAVIGRAGRDLRALQEGGADAVMFSNEFSLPYLTKTEPVTATAMARVIGELMNEIEIPLGVNVLWDPVASLDLAAATDAVFIREVFTGVYGSDYGLWDTSVGESVRHARRVGAGDVRLLFNVVPESATYLGGRSLEDLVRSTVFNARPDGLCVSGLTAGTRTDPAHLQKVKEAAGPTPVFVNTGVTEENAAEQLAIADGAVVGTFFKRDGVFENEIDAGRVTRLMNEVKELRSERG
jgi:membrane complex biogenesis BtpA family protein